MQKLPQSIELTAMIFAESPKAKKIDALQEETSQENNFRLSFEALIANCTKTQVILKSFIVNPDFQELNRVLLVDLFKNEFTVYTPNCSGLLEALEYVESKTDFEVVCNG